MTMWTGIVFIVALVSISEMFKYHAKSRREGSASKQELESLLKRLDDSEAAEAKLRSRVETLERIVTDDKADLKRQFDYLDKAS